MSNTEIASSKPGYKTDIAWTIKHPDGLEAIRVSYDEDYIIVANPHNNHKSIRIPHDMLQNFISVLQFAGQQVDN